MRRATLAIVVVLLAACSGGAEKREPAEASPADSAFHRANLAKGESDALAAELVEVPGYFYQDVGEAELETELETASSMQSLAASFHGIRLVSSGDEIAFLALFVIDPTDAIHSQAYEDRLGTWMTGTEDVTRETFSDQTVFLAETPTEPASRYKYVWDRHGTLGWADGSDRATLERWLTTYFATEVILPSENPALVERLVSVQAFTYTNSPYMLGTSFGADRSVHQVFDETHSFAMIVLVGPEASLGEREFDAGFVSEVEKGGAQLADAGGFEVQGVAVHRRVVRGADPRMVMFTWTWADAGIGGALLTERPDIAEPFLRAFLDAQPS